MLYNDSYLEGRCAIGKKKKLKLFYGQGGDGGNKRYYKNVNFSILLILKLIFRIPDGTLS